MAFCRPRRPTRAGVELPAAGAGNSIGWVGLALWQRRDGSVVSTVLESQARILHRLPVPNEGSFFASVLAKVDSAGLSDAGPKTGGPNRSRATPLSAVSVNIAALGGDAAVLSLEG